MFPSAEVVFCRRGGRIPYHGTEYFGLQPYRASALVKFKETDKIPALAKKVRSTHPQFLLLRENCKLAKITGFVEQFYPVDGAAIETVTLKSRDSYL